MCGGTHTANRRGWADSGSGLCHLTQESAWKRRSYEQHVYLHYSAPCWQWLCSYQSSWFLTFLWVRPWCFSLGVLGGPHPAAQTGTAQHTHTLMTQLAAAQLIISSVSCAASSPAAYCHHPGNNTDDSRAEHDLADDSEIRVNQPTRIVLMRFPSF